MSIFFFTNWFILCLHSCIASASKKNFFQRTDTMLVRTMDGCVSECSFWEAESLFSPQTASSHTHCPHWLTLSILTLSQTTGSPLPTLSQTTVSPFPTLAQTTVSSFLTRTQVPVIYFSIFRLYHVSGVWTLASTLSCAICSYIYIILLYNILLLYRLHIIIYILLYILFIILYDHITISWHYCSYWISPLF